MVVAVGVFLMTQYIDTNETIYDVDNKNYLLLVFSLKLVIYIVTFCAVVLYTHSDERAVKRFFIRLSIIIYIIYNIRINLIENMY